MNTRSTGPRDSIRPARIHLLSGKVIIPAKTPNSTGTVPMNGAIKGAMKGARHPVLRPPLRATAAHLFFRGEDPKPCCLEDEGAKAAESTESWTPVPAAGTSAKADARQRLQSCQMHLCQKGSVQRGLGQTDEGASDHPRKFCGRSRLPGSSFRL